MITDGKSPKDHFASATNALHKQASLLLLLLLLLVQEIIDKKDLQAFKEQWLAVGSGLKGVVQLSFLEVTWHARSPLPPTLLLFMAGKLLQSILAEPI